MKMRPFYIFSSLCLLLIMMSCGDEDPILSGNLSITPSSTSFSGIRGTDVDVSATISAADGIQSIKATPEVGAEQIYTIPAAATTFAANFTFSIPGNAVLNKTYNVAFEVVDKDGDTQKLDVSVNTDPLLTTTPTTYAFTRDGASTVSFSGQNERLDMVEAIKAYLQTGDNGSALSASVLNDAYANTNGNGNGFFSFTSTKQLKDKTFQPDLDNDFMENAFAIAEAASQSGATATNGTAGLIVRENSGNTVLVDANGREFTQIIEKGLMGTVMYNQIYNTYFSDDRTGNAVENTALKDGKNYTDLEHHWDEAFGYWNPPLDFTSNWPADRADEDRFWSHYSNTVDPHIGTNDRIMNAFLAGRTAIVNNDLDGKETQKAILFETLELVTAAVAIHYINDALGALNESKTGEAFHVLSEAWAFTNALRYSAQRKLDLARITEIMEEDFGADSNFWNVTPTGLNKAKATLVGAYQELEAVQNDL